MSSGACDIYRGHFKNMELSRSGNHDFGNNNGLWRPFGRVAWNFGDTVQKRGQVMTDAVTVALITGGITLVGTVLSNWFTHSKTIYRIEQLEKKVEKHNNLVERMYIAEGQIKVHDEQIKDLNGDLAEVKGKS